MRIRTMAAAVVAAAGLSVALTGAASAATTEEPPSGDFVIATCEDGELEVRPATEEDRERIEEMRARADGGPVVFGRAGEGRGRMVRALPPDAEPGRDGRVVRVVVGPGERGDRAKATCAAPASP
jgi:L-aminopeptidase/D-esterase-like protein